MLLSNRQRASQFGWCRSKSAGGTSLLISFVHPRSTATLRPAARCAGFSSQLREGSGTARFRNPIGDSCPIPRSRHHRAPRERNNDLVFCQEPGGRQDSVDLCRLDSVQSTTPARGLYSLGLVSGQDSRVQEYKLIATRKYFGRVSLNKRLPSEIVVQYCAPAITGLLGK